MTTSLGSDGVWAIKKLISSINPDETTLTNLFLTDERAPKHADTLTDHRDLELMVRLEPINDLTESRVILENESIPERPLRFAVFLFGSSDGFGEAEERQSKVDEPILVVV